MVMQKELINTIATLRYAGKSVAYIAGFLNIAAADVAATVKAFKL